MVRFIQQNPAIAKGSVNSRERKQECTALWSQLADLLNAEGPPIKSTDSWKKVWSDYKFNVKVKYGKRLKKDDSVLFSAMDETVAEVLNLEEEFDVKPQKRKRFDFDLSYPTEEIDEHPSYTTTFDRIDNEHFEMETQFYPSSDIELEKSSTNQTTFSDLLRKEFILIREKHKRKEKFYDKICKITEQSKIMMEEFNRQNERILELKEKKQEMTKKVWEDNKIYRANKLALMRQKIQIQKEMLALRKK